MGSPARGRVRYRQAPPAVTYVNVFEVRAGAEEVMVTLGYGQPRRVQAEGEVSQELVIDASQRIALTPQAARRLAAALGQSVALMDARQAAASKAATEADASVEDEADFNESVQALEPVAADA